MSVSSINFDDILLSSVVLSSEVSSILLSLPSQVSSTSSPQSTLNLIHQQTMSTTSPSTLFRL
jgi:hypothetical protein